MITVYSVPGEITSPKFCRAFAAGCQGRTEVHGRLRPGDVALFGSPALWPLLTRARKAGRTWYYGDKGYFGRLGQYPGEPYYRITKNAYQHDGSGNAEPARFERFGVGVEKWKRDGRHVLVCPPGPVFQELMGISGWLETTVAELKRHTDRQVVVRRKPRQTDPRPLAIDLRNCWAVVTYMSNVAVESVLAGVPVFCTGQCAGSTMGLSDLSMIETPHYPGGRRQWASNLAANQWTMKEIAAGTAWRELNADL